MTSFTGQVRYSSAHTTHEDVNRRTDDKLYVTRPQKTLTATETTNWWNWYFSNEGIGSFSLSYYIIVH